MSTRQIGDRYFMKKLTGGKIKQYIEKLRAVLKCRRGTTLVELIITFALIGLFVAGTCQMIAASVRTYHQIRGANQAHQVADTLMDKITGEIEGAQVGVPYDEDSDGITLHIFEAGDKIELYDRTGSHIYITVNEAKELLIYYYPVKSQSETSSGSENRYEAVNWT